MTMVRVILTKLSRLIFRGPFARAKDHVERGNELSSAGDHHRAIESYDRAIALDEGYAEAYKFRETHTGILNRPISP